VITPHETFQEKWAEYYRLRRSARLGVLALPVILVVLDKGPLAIWLKGILGTLRDNLQVAIVLSIIGVTTFVIAWPLLKWMAWRCPNCGNKFVQTKMEANVLAALGKAWIVLIAFSKLAFDSRCVTCGLKRGTSKTAADDTRQTKGMRIER